MQAFAVDDDKPSFDKASTSSTHSQPHCPKEGQFSEIDNVGGQVDEIEDFAAVDPASFTEDCRVGQSLSMEGDIEISTPSAMFAVHPGASNQAPRKSIIRSMSSYIRPRDDAARLKRTREVAHQCFWYAGAFYINWAVLSVRLVHEEKFCNSATLLTIPLVSNLIC
jgi:hypothetical protein